ncbi:MAG: metalloregulator ArsR/SmtB family transcription factor [Bacillota bacterium]
MATLTKKMEEIFKVLGDETRLKIIKLLASNTLDSLCVTDLANKIGISQQAASQHIKLMKMTGFLEPKKKGLHVYYKINIDNLINFKKDIDTLFDMAFMKCEDCKNCLNCDERIM